jgi:hypothetical protein
LEGGSIFVDDADIRRIVLWNGCPRVFFEDDILDIEGYALGNLPFSNYPQKLFVPRLGNASSTLQSMVFISPRSNADIDQNGGYYLTYLQDSSLLFF